jgi:hypothetical protein
VKLEDLLDEILRGDAAVALDRRADPGCLRAPLVLVHVGLRAWQARREHPDGRERDDRAHEDEPPEIAVVHGR